MLLGFYFFPSMSMYKAAVAGASLFRGDFICDTLTCMLSSSMKQRPDRILTNSPSTFRNRSVHELKTSIPSPVSRTTRKIWPAGTADAVCSLCRSPGPPAERHFMEPEYSSLLFFCDPAVFWNFCRLWKKGLAFLLVLCYYNWAVSKGTATAVRGCSSAG